MANERLRAALKDAGVDVEGLARLVGVQPETVYRWLGGRLPYPRHRSAVAGALGRAEQDLWSEPDGDQAAADLSGEIIGAWGRVDAVPGEWSELLSQASERIDLAGHRLDEILGAPGTPEQLSEKAAAGCQVRVVLPAADSLWLTEAARRSGKADVDYVGRTELHRRVELALGHLQPLLDHPTVDARTSYDELSIAVLRFDEEMLVSLMLAGAGSGQRPMLHLRRDSEGGLFDQLAAHVDSLHARGNRLVRDLGLYPDPSKIPQRYQPITEATYRGQLRWLERELGSAERPSQPATKRPGKLRRRPSQR